MQLFTRKEQKAFRFNNKLDEQILAYRIKCMCALPYMLYDNFDDLTGIPKDVRLIQNYVKGIGVEENGITRRVLRMSGEQEIQNMVKGTDYPEFLTNLFKEVQTMEPFDNEWAWFYDIRPLEGGGYDVYLTEDNITTHRTPPGTLVRYYGSTGSKYRAYVRWYSTGLAVDRRLLYERDFYKIANDIKRQRAASQRNKAEVAYALIEAIPAGQNIAWQLPDPAGLPVTSDKYTMSRDAQTIIAACVQLITDNQDKPDVLTQGANTEFHVLCPFQLDGRLANAISYKVQNLNSAPAAVKYKLVLHQTTMLTSSTVYYVGIPKGETTGGSLLEYTVFDEFNKDLFADEKAAWESFAFNIGNTEQFVRCATA